MKGMSDATIKSSINQTTEGMLTRADAMLFEKVKQATQETYEHYQNLGEARAGGYAVEQVHAELHNFSEKLTGHGTIANAIDDNKLADIYLGNQQYQLKFLKTASDTYKEITQTFGEHCPKTQPFEKWKYEIADKFNLDPNGITPNTTYYREMKLVVPTDQMADVQARLTKEINRAKNQGNMQEAHRLLKFKDQITDKLSDGTNESIGITKAEANQIGKTGQLPAKLRQKIFEQQKVAMLKKSLRTGMSAAVLSFAIEVAPKLLKMLATNDFNVDDFIQDGIEGGINASQNFMVTSISSWIVQSGGLLENAVNKLSANQVAAMVLLTYNTIQSAGKFARGKISATEMGHEISRDVTVTGFTLLGGTAALALVPEAVVPVIVAQLVGSMVGALIGSKLYETESNVFLGLSAKYGWTMFGLVEQDYSLSDEQLEKMGFDVSDFEQARWDQLEVGKIEFDAPIFEELDFEQSMIKPIRRGVIGVNKIGYLIE